MRGTSIFLTFAKMCTVMEHIFAKRGVEAGVSCSDRKSFDMHRPAAEGVMPGVVFWFILREVNCETDCPRVVREMLSEID